MIELEIYGGATASYLASFGKRRFRTTAEAAAYVDRVTRHLDGLGVRSAHPMRLYDASGSDDKPKNPGISGPKS